MSFFDAVNGLNPLRWWRGPDNGVIADVTGNGPDATITGTVVEGVDLGPPNISLGVEMDDGTISTVDDTSFTFPNEVTFFAVLESLENINNWAPFFAFGVPGGSATDGIAGLSHKDSTQEVRFAVSNPGESSNNFSAESNDPVINNPWFVFGIWDLPNEHIRIWVAEGNNNVVLQDTVTRTTAVSHTDPFMWSMLGSADGSRRMRAKGAEFAVFDSVLSEAEMNSIVTAAYDTEEAAGGEISFTGSNAVIFADDSEPAEGATVYAVRPGEVEAAATGTTDANGEVTLTGLDAGTYATWAERGDGTGNIQTTQVIKREVT